MEAEPRSALDLLRAYSAAIQALHERGIVRTKNIVGCYAETLFARAFGWELPASSNKAFDATDGMRTYQIKSRRVSASNPSCQLGDMPKDNEITFDCLAAVIFEEDFSVRYAAVVPAPVLIGLRTRRDGRPRFIFRPAVLSVPGVEDVTERLRAAQATF
ncbi:hypothetical protein [Caulobacter sp. BP25]|uniref:hypothetical protein n=1 Tax=Caulobacter sp. BP25 TaxID=2048900 RepID=UPI000C12C994|nr:hypothetical protein [Caulobacter sp. BP25]PHY20763.1 hypothetical protein CSW59_05940 [Caulobacter sp. BP25]